MHKLYPSIIDKASTQKKQVAILIDPDKYSSEGLAKLANLAEGRVDFFMVGGSLTSVAISTVVEQLKQLTQIPVVLFPGNVLQLTPLADAILLLSLISGRNAEFLIGNHVIAAPFLKQSQIEVIPTGYMLFENSQITSVEYMSGTKPLPINKPEIAVATAIAGEMLGLKMIYLEAGSGAASPVPCEIITEVRRSISVPLIVGGGIRTATQLHNTFNAGADIAVIGTAIENNLGLIEEISKKK